MYEMSAWRRQSPAAYKNHRFTTVSDVRPARSDERVAPSSSEICISPQFWTSDEHEVTKGLREHTENLLFTTVLGVRRSLFALIKGCLGHVKNCISPQFWASDEHEVTRGLLRQSRKFAFHHSFGRPTSTKWREGCPPPRPTKPTLRKRKEEILKEEQHFRRAAVSAAFLSSSSQQPFSAALLSSSSQQPFSAALLSSSSQQLFSAALLSSSSQQPSSAAFLSSSSQQLFSAALLGSSSQLSSCCGQGLVVS